MAIATAESEQLKILQSFCEAPNEPLSHLRKPFTVGAYSYASNRHLAVRVAALAEVPERPEVRFNVDLLPWPYVSTPWQALPALPPADGECFTCTGHGRVVVCDECSGEGEVSWASALHTYTATCLECDGSGVWPSAGEQTEWACPDCAGTGYRWDNEELVIEGIPFAVVYLAKMARLPDPVMAIGMTMHDIPIPCLLFSSSNGFYGVLASRRSKPS